MGKVGMFGVCALLTAQAVLQAFIWFRAEKRDKVDENEFVCDTLYLDLALPNLQIGVLFVAQFCIWWFYLTSILGNFDFGQVNYWFWLVAYLTMQMTMIFNRGSDSVLGNPFPTYDVYRLIVNAEKMTLKLKDSDDEPFKISKAN